MRPWYIQTMDAAHRLSVISIMGFSAYLGYGVFRSIQHNARNKQLSRQKADESDTEQSSVAEK